MYKMLGDISTFRDVRRFSISIEVKYHSFKMKKFQDIEKIVRKCLDVKGNIEEIFKSWPPISLSLIL